MTEPHRETCDPAALNSLMEGLRNLGVDVDLSEIRQAGCVKVVCVRANLGDSVEALSEKARDQVVMVRVDGDTAETLDAWVETGAVRSRSEAAALFIREGLELRADELRELEGALARVEEAKEQLRRKAETVLGREEPRTS